MAVRNLASRPAATARSHPPSPVDLLIHCTARTIGNRDNAPGAFSAHADIADTGALILLRGNLAFGRRFYQRPLPPFALHFEE